MDKIIDLTKYLNEKENQWAVDAMNTLYGMGPIANDIVRLISDLVVKECEVGLGLIDVNEDLELHFFGMVNEVYQQAAGDCYFCSDVDPNEKEVDMQTQFCPDCKLKLSNFAQFIGHNPGYVLKGMGTRKVQKSRLAK